jgi:energy-coupling factor transport system ATP-binding protein
MDIILENLEHVYNPGSPLEVRGLHPLSLRLPSGTFLGIVGGTGSGKTTLVKHLNGMLKPTGGRMLADGKDASAFHSDLRRRVGLVFQRPERQLFEQTVYDDIAFVLRRSSGLTEKEINARVQEACRFTGLDMAEIGDRSPQSLPDGQKRKVAIAGVLVNRPEVLILDEPVVGLDPPSCRDLSAFLARLKNSGDRSVVVVSHDMEAFLPVLDLLLVLKKGRMVARGKPKEVIADMILDPDLLGLFSFPALFSAKLPWESSAAQVCADRDTDSHDGGTC